jgi:putative hydrolases of HD superfamily
MERSTMITKYTHTRELLPEKTHPMIELFFEFAQLKNLYRQGYPNHGIPLIKCETDADHTFGVALLGYIISDEYRPDLDSMKVMKVGLFHELGEIYGGDITPRDNISADEKFAREYASVKKTFSGTKLAVRHVQIWLEYARQETPEARFVKQVDKLETALQTNLFERLGHRGLDDFFPYMQERISSPELRYIMEDLLKLRK